MTTRLENRWRSQNNKHDFEWEGPLVAYWEAELDPISDDYTPDEIPAIDLLKLWGKRVGEKHADGLVPIHWFIESREAAKFNCTPRAFTYDHFHGKFQIEDFFTFFSWPEHVITGEPLNWLTLPVADKLWNKHRADKGGFIQEATGWKPSMLQPFVYLPSLLSATGSGR